MGAIPFGLEAAGSRKYHCLEWEAPSPLRQWGHQAEGWCPGLGLGGYELRSSVGSFRVDRAQDGTGRLAGPGSLWEVLAQVRVRELEEQCRTQTERFSLLAQELQAFRLHPGPLDLLTSALGYSTLGDHPPPPCCCSTPQPCRGSGPKGKVDPRGISLESPGLELLYRAERSESEKANNSPRVTQQIRARPGQNKSLMGGEMSS